MAIFLKDVSIENCGVGIQTEGNVNLVTEDITIKNTGIAIRNIDQPSFPASIGLKSDTPKEVILEIIKEIRNNPNQDPQKIARKYSLEKYIQNGANLATILSALLGLR